MREFGNKILGYWSIFFNETQVLVIFYFSVTVVFAILHLSHALSLMLYALSLVQLFRRTS